MSSRSSSLRLSDLSDSSRGSSSEPEDGVEGDQSPEPEPPRPTQQDYQTYTALVRSIVINDNLIAKRIIATKDQRRNSELDELCTARYAQSSGWPLQSSDLPPLDPDALEDSILAFASAYIRQNNLFLPRHQQHQDSTGLQDLDEIIPDLLPSIMETVNQLLDNLAAMRPAETRKTRATLRPMTWNSVLSAGMIGAAPLDYDVLLRTNQKARTLLQVEGEDVLDHRLQSLQSAALKREEVPDEPVHTMRPRDVMRPHHLSKQERESRAIKREQKAAKRLEREQVKALAKATKRQRRKQRSKEKS